jgi:hypothetical protein
VNIRRLISTRNRISARGIQIVIGWLWLLDGFLQLQPRMFTRNFASMVSQTAGGQPHLVQAPVVLFAHIFLLQPAVFNTLIAMVQLAIGLLILLPRTARLGLWCSVPWGLFVWFIGESIGGLASGHASLLTGAPGAAILYVFLALSTLGTRKRPASWLLVVWAFIWLMGSVYQLLPGQNNMLDLTTTIQSNAASNPAWLASIQSNATNLTAGLAHAAPMTTMTGMQMGSGPISMTPTQAVAGRGWIILLAAAQCAIALAVFFPGAWRLCAVVAGCMLSCLFWVVGQSLGELFTGLATDPGTGPLLILLGIAILGCSPSDLTIQSLFATYVPHRTGKHLAVSPGRPESMSCLAISKFPQSILDKQNRTGI